MLDRSAGLPWRSCRQYAMAVTYNQGGWQPQQGQRQSWPQQGGWPAGGPGWQQQRPQAWPQQPGGWPQPGAFPPPQGAPYGPPRSQPPPLPPTARKRSPLAVILLAFAGVVVLLGVGVALLGRGGSSVAGGPAYQNESYTPPPADLNPPALPVPETVSQAKELLTNNKLYAQTAPRPIRCDVPEINLMTADNATLKKHMEDVMACLMREWIVPVEKAGYQLPRPSVTVYDTPITTKCGKLPMPNAVYCGADQQVYYAKNLPTVVPASIRNSRFVVETIMAHEFGHAIQARTAILISATYFEKNASSTAAANELSRRTELQADCFAGIFLGSVSQSAGMDQQELNNALALFEAIGDDKLSGKDEGGHGSSASRRYWGEMGLASTQIGACNTYVAEPSAVR